MKYLKPASPMSLYFKIKEEIFEAKFGESKISVFQAYENLEKFLARNPDQIKIIKAWNVWEDSLSDDYF